jgi:hypothetical protein
MTEADGGTEALRGPLQRGGVALLSRCAVAGRLA